ncbi:MAG TPA: hypothetical protein VKD22_12010 [Ramlibacter sp.]|nr:hypothetical protein [Ramlibacter sp.]
MAGNAIALSARAAFAAALVIACVTASAQDKKPAGGAAVLPPVTVTAPRDFVEKSYRKMIRGMDLFERLHAYAPNASLRFKLLPRKRDTNMKHIELEVLGPTVDIEVPIAPDDTFALMRNQQAWDEDAIVTPNRRSRSMTWRAEIRTPGLPPRTRRLGDLRLECRVGLEAGLVSNNDSLISKMIHVFTDDPERYCSNPDAHYLFFADKPLFGVTLVAGNRRETLPVSELYAAASEDPGLPYDLPFCDCEVLVDRTYFMPLGDRSWPDDTLVEFEYMDDP